MSKKSLFCHLFSAIVFLMLLAGFSGCNNLTGGNNKPSNDNDDKVYLQVNVASASRTALPQFDIDSISDFEFTIEGKGPGDSALTPLETESNTSGVYASLTALQQASFPVETGTWTFKLTASKNGTVLSDEISKKITTGENSISFDLKWEDENLSGTGDVTFTFDYSAASNKNLVSRVTAQLYNYDTVTGEVSPAGNEINLAVSNKSVTYSSTGLNSRTYQIMLRLYDDADNLLMRYPEMVIITGGQVSSSTKAVSVLENVYTITFIYNCTDYELDPSITLPAKYTRFTFTDPYSLPNADDLTRTGYTFEDWFTDASFSGNSVYNIPAGSSGDLIYYAKWNANTDTPYKIKHWKQRLEADGVTHNETNYELAATDNLTGTTDTEITPVAKDTTTGDFLGFTAPDSTELSQLKANIAPDGSTEINLYYIRNSYRVSYKDYDGNPIGSSTSYLYEESVNVDFVHLPSDRTGYDFIGWKKSGDDTIYTSTGTTSFTMGAANDDFVSQWRSHPYQVTLHYNGGTFNGETGFSIVLDVDGRESGDNCFEPGEYVPTKSGFVFGGWYTDEALTEQFTDTEIDLSQPNNNPSDFHDWNLYAKWNPPANFVYVKGAVVQGEITNSPQFVAGASKTIPDMLVSDHEVTQGEYETYCMYGSSSDKPSTWYGVGDDCAVYGVNWYDAIVYCNLRSRAENLQEVYSISGETNPALWDGILSDDSGGKTKYCGPNVSKDAWNTINFNILANGYRLPTSAEWEYIARNGNEGIPTPLYDYAYSSGEDTLADIAWYNENSGSMVQIVKTDKVEGKDSANALGIYDMCGNVSEWCWDFNETELNSVQRVIHDGCFSDSGGSEYLKVYKQGYNDPYMYILGSGFRVVRTVAGTQEYLGMKPAPTDIGDIVFTDGSAMPYQRGLLLDSAHKQAAIALIFYSGDGLNNSGDTSTRILGLGLKFSGEADYSWAKQESLGYTKKFENIQIMQSTSVPADGTVYYQYECDAQTYYLTGDLDGSDNWSEICSQDPDGTASEALIAENYPAFNYANNYAANAGLTGTYATGWYMPTIVELYCICINNIMLEPILYLFNDDAWMFGNNSIWSSSQETDANNAWCIDASVKLNQCDVKDTVDTVCVIRAF